MKKYNEYGLLFTVAALLFIVVYARGSYDAWDLVISLMGAFFGIRFMWENTSGDIFSRVVASFIGSTGTIIAITAASVIFPFVPNFQDFMDAAPWGFSNLFLISVAGSLLLLIIKKLSR